MYSYAFCSSSFSTNSNSNNNKLQATSERQMSNWSKVSHLIFYIFLSALLFIIPPLRLYWHPDIKMSIDLCWAYLDAPIWIIFLKIFSNEQLYYVISKFKPQTRRLLYRLGFNDKKFWWKTSMRYFYQNKQRFD